MNPQRARILYLCMGFWILMDSGWAADTDPVYVALNGPVLLSIPGYPNAERDQVTWRDGKGNTMGRFKDSISFHQIRGCECELFRNGSLYLKRLGTVGDETYTVTVFNQMGKQISSHSVKVTVIKSVAAPVLSVTCGERDIRLRCEVSDEDTPDEMEMTWNNSRLIQSTKTKSVGRNVSLETHGNVTCATRNRVSDRSDSKKIDCRKHEPFIEFFTLEMIAAVAAGGVAFLIFIILLSYFVSRSCCQKSRIGEEGASICYENNISIQERQLPGPPGQQETQTLIQPPAEPQGHSPGPRPPAPRIQSQSRPPKQSKKGSHSKPNGATVEKQAPQAQTQPNPSQSIRPPVPTNHPSTRPPRPQPRTRSRAAHQPPQ
uniref:T-cell surface antigen CD2 n=1 Tax=Xenopus tropicalis TaxID=8364 RepID=A0A803JEF2_XENTR